MTPRDEPSQAELGTDKLTGVQRDLAELQRLGQGFDQAPCIADQMHDQLMAQRTQRTQPAQVIGNGHIGLGSGYVSLETVPLFGTPNSEHILNGREIAQMSLRELEAADMVLSNIGHRSWLDERRLHDIRRRIHFHNAVSNRQTNEGKNDVSEPVTMAELRDAQRAYADAAKRCEAAGAERNRAMAAYNDACNEVTRKRNELEQVTARFQAHGLADDLGTDDPAEDEAITATLPVRMRW